MIKGSKCQDILWSLQRVRYDGERFLLLSSLLPVHGRTHVERQFPWTHVNTSNRCIHRIKKNATELKMFVTDRQYRTCPTSLDSSWPWHIPTTLTEWPAVRLTVPHDAAILRCLNEVYNRSMLHLCLHTQQTRPADLVWNHRWQRPVEARHNVWYNCSI